MDPRSRAILLTNLLQGGRRFRRASAGSAPKALLVFPQAVLVENVSYYCKTGLAFRLMKGDIGYCKSPSQTVFFPETVENQFVCFLDARVETFFWHFNTAETPRSLKPRKSDEFLQETKLKPCYAPFNSSCGEVQVAQPQADLQNEKEPA